MTNIQLSNLKSNVACLNAIITRCEEKEIELNENIVKMVCGTDKFKKVAIKKESGKGDNVEKTVFGYVLMLSDSPSKLNVKFAGTTYSIEHHVKRSKGVETISNKIEFVSGHGISKKDFDADKETKSFWTDADQNACTYYSKCDKALIDQYRFSEINVTKRAEKIYAQVEEKYEETKAALIEVIGIDMYNELYNEYEEKQTKKAEKAKQARENKKAENKAKKEEKAA